MCLSALGNYDKCLEVINAGISRHGQLPDLLIMRARINYMFGNVSSIGSLLLDSNFVTYNVNSIGSLLPI